MRRAVTLLSALAALLGGCGLTNQMHSVSWTATLEHTPDAQCIQAALAPLPDIFRTDLRNRPVGYVVGIYLKPSGQSEAEAREARAKIEVEMKRIGVRNYQDFADINIVVAPGKRGNFAMGYLGWPRNDDPREVAAQEIIRKLSAACIPSLIARVKENHDSEWMPYMFNI